MRGATYWDPLRDVRLPRRPHHHRSASPRTCSCSATTTRWRSPSATARSTASAAGGSSSASASARCEEEFDLLGADVRRPRRPRRRRHPRPARLALAARARVSTATHYAYDGFVVDPCARTAAGADLDRRPHRRARCAGQSSSPTAGRRSACHAPTWPRWSPGPARASLGGAGSGRRRGAVRARPPERASLRSRRRARSRAATRRPASPTRERRRSTCASCTTRSTTTSSSLQRCGSSSPSPPQVQMCGGQSRGPRRWARPGRAHAASGALITAACPALAASSSSTPRCPSRSQMPPRIAAALSPMPPVNTSVSRPPSTGQRADVLAGLVAEGVDGQRGALILLAAARAASACPTCRPTARRVPASRSTSCSRRAGVVAPLAQQVHGHAGVEVAAAGAHDQSARRREAHRRVDRLPVMHGDHAGAVAEVRDDGAAELRCADRIDDVLVRQAMEAVPPHARFPEGGRQRQPLCELGHVVVERGVEARHLRDVPSGADRVDRRRSPPACATARTARARGGRSSTPSSTRTGSAWRGPPCTTRWPAAPGGGSP